MAMPDFQRIMLPLLKFCADGEEHTNREAIDLGSMLPSHCQSGEKKVGFTMKIQEDGFSGIAGIIGAGGARTTNAKLTDGGR